MTPDQLYGALRDVVMWIVAILIFLWGRDRKQVADAIEARFQTEAEEVALQFALRDQRINAIDRKQELAAERFSREGDRITVKMEDFRERLVRVESALGGRRLTDA